jgi:hypothetical protein
MARHLLFLRGIVQHGEEKTLSEIAKYFPAGQTGIALPAKEYAEVLSKVDPLAPIPDSKANERRYARNMIAMALFDISQIGDENEPIMHQMVKKNLSMPQAGFDMKTFEQAVDKVYGEKGLLRKKVTARSEDMLAKIRKMAAAEAGK